MAVKFFKKTWIHILIWGAMLIYFFVAPALYTRAFTNVGKPLEGGSIPDESDRVVFAVDGIEPYAEDEEKVYNLFGWALLTPEEGKTADTFVREIVLFSEDEVYFFPVISVYRRPRLPHKLDGIKVDWDNFGYFALIADDLIKPGRYRVGLIIKDPKTGAAYYRDKPVYHLIKTPNSLDLED